MESLRKLMSNKIIFWNNWLKMQIILLPIIYILSDQLNLNK